MPAGAGDGAGADLRGFTFYFDQASMRWVKDETGQRGGTVEDWADMDVGGQSGQGYAPWPLVHTALTAVGQESIEPRRALELQKAGAVIVDVRPADDFEREHIDGAVNVPLYRPVEGRDTMDNLKRIAMAFFAMRATERNPKFAEEAKASLPAGCPLVVTCNTGGYLEVTIDKKRGGKVVKSFEDKERVFGWESRSLKACHELRTSGFSDIYHLRGGLQTWKFEGFPSAR